MKGVLAWASPQTGVIELFTAESGSWTILITMPGGVTCMMGSGEGWEDQRKLPALLGEVS